MPLILDFSCLRLKNTTKSKLVDPLPTNTLPHLLQSNYLPTKEVLSQDMLLAAGRSNNGFTECGTGGRIGNGIMGIYSASHTAKRGRSKSETLRKGINIFLSKLEAITVIFEGNLLHFTI